MSKKVAGIILAAGESKRLGTPKQLLNFNGTTLINRTIELAVNSNLSPIVVVLGAYYQEINAQLSHSEDIKVINNQDWNEGQSTSLIKGVEVIKDLSIPAVILLCDQPLLKSNIVKKIVNIYKTSNVDVVMLRTGRKRTPPVLMTPVCYPNILELTGDRGARDIVDNFRIAYLENTDESILQDIDTKDDYNKVLYK